MPTEYKPGRELDALVATRVMGWTTKEFDHPHGFVATGWITPTGQGPLSGEMLPRYSTDIAAAWEVVGKLREKHCCIKFHLDNEAPQWAVILRGPKFTSRKAPSCTKIISAQATELPTAICLAALRAVGAL